MSQLLDLAFTDQYDHFIIEVEPYTFPKIADRLDFAKSKLFLRYECDARSYNWMMNWITAYGVQRSFSFTKNKNSSFFRFLRNYISVLKSRLTSVRRYTKLYKSRA